MTKGGTVVDPFGGIGTTGIEGAYRGCHVVCCELEPKFVTLCQENFALHQRAWEDLGLPLPVVVQGDSRHLRQHVRPALDALISSPPFLGSNKGDAGLATSAHARDVISRGGLPKVGHLTQADYGTSEGQLSVMPAGEIDAVVASPPYAESLTPGNKTVDRERHQDSATKAGHGALGGGQLTHSNRYSFDSENLGNKPAGDVDAIISSPPYAEIASGAGGLNTKPGAEGQQSGRSAASPSQDTDQRYGNTDGQLAKMPKTDVDAVISSPPYAETILSGGGGIAHEMRGTYREGQNYGDAAGQLGAMPSEDVDAVLSSPPYEAAISERGGRQDPDATPRLDPNGNPWPQETDLKPYGQDPEQLGSKEGETFWSAARDIVAESYAILKPGGHAVWIVKAFVRDKQIVDFPGDWRRLCEHVGFETVTEVHAMLVKESTHDNLFGDTVTTKKERKSFFRRLAESKGSPRIDYEVVYIMRKR